MLLHDLNVVFAELPLTPQIWDLGGQREFVSMLPLVSNDAVAILFMFDLTRKATLNSVKEWYRQARGFNKVRLSKCRGLLLRGVEVGGIDQRAETNQISCTRNVVRGWYVGTTAAA